jgi:hypothetical protein
LIVPIDHFGKDVSTGTRNASSKEDAADTILACLGERSIEGRVTNPRAALRKVKGAETGVVFPFETREVVVGETKDGRSISTYAIDWRGGASEGDDAPKGKPAKKWSKGLRIFKRAFENKLADSGKRLRPFIDGPEVLAVSRETVRAEFVKAHPSDNRKTKNTAFERAIKDAVDAGLICTREIDEEGTGRYLAIG